MTRPSYLLQFQPAAVIDLLVTDDTNPRSIAFQLQRIDELISALPADKANVGLGQDEKLAKHLLDQVRIAANEKKIVAHACSAVLMIYYSMD